MRVVSFNIHHGTVGRRGPVDPEQLGAVCASFDADVIALQEVDRDTYRTRRADLAAVAAGACGMAHVFGSSRWYPGGRYGTALLARGTITTPTGQETTTLESYITVATTAANVDFAADRTTIAVDEVVFFTNLTVSPSEPVPASAF